MDTDLSFNRRDTAHRDANQVRPPRRIGLTILVGTLLLLVGGFVGLMLAVELLGNVPPQAAREAATTGTDRPAPPAASAPQAPDQLRQEASRMQLNAEVQALRQAAQAEQARLDNLARQRADAEAQLAALLRDAAASGAAPPADTALPTPPPAAPPQPTPTPSASLAARPPPPSRARPEGRQEGRPDGRSEGRVVLHYQAGSPTAQQAAEDAAAVLRDAGVEGVELRAAPGVPGQRVVRYHRAEDAGLAARLAGRLGRGWAVQDNRAFDPGGAARGLEVWLPER